MTSRLQQRLAKFDLCDEQLGFQYLKNTQNYARSLWYRMNGLRRYWKKARQTIPMRRCSICSQAVGRAVGWLTLQRQPQLQLIYYCIYGGGGEGSINITAGVLDGVWWRCIVLLAVRFGGVEGNGATVCSPQQRQKRAPIPPSVCSSPEGL